MGNRTMLSIAGAFLFFGCAARAAADVPQEARVFFASGEYSKAIEVLNKAAASAPNDADLQHFLARSYFEDEQFDKAVSAAEKSVTLTPNSSAYHELLGRIYGEKASRSGWFSALGLAKKARKEFETAVRLDEHNFSATQAMIEFDCSAPGIAGGGEDKARPEIQKLSEMDAAEGRYAAGNCRRQKKDYAAADAEFQKALALHPKSADPIYDIGDYYMKRDQAEGLEVVVREGQRANPSDPRADFYRAVILVLQKQKQAESAKLIRDYIAHVPKRNNYPSKAIAHYWLGRIEENQNNSASAKREYQEALNLEPKNRWATEALKRLQRD